MKRRVTVKTSKLLILAVALLFCAAIAKLCFIVLADKTDGVNLKNKAASITTVKKTLYASRGDIYDVNGEVLARTVNSYTLIAYLSESRTTDKNNPKHVVDKEYTAEKLSEVLGMEKEKILERLNKKAYQVEFGTKGSNLTENMKSKIDALDLPGIDFLVSQQRYYDKAGFASYIIGYAKANDGEITGELGVEKYYDNELSGKNGSTEYQKYTSGNYQIPNTPTKIKKAKDGSDIYLTIESNIQFIAEKAVSTLSSEHESDWIIFTVMDAHTGAIVASATSPNFNPNDTNTITSYMNPLVSYQYEPGSVMKIFSYASSIENGTYKGDATYKSGSLEVADVVIRDANRSGWGTISYDTGFAYSSNVAATLLAQKVGTTKLKGYYKDLGFGSKTGIELSNEATGDISFKYPSELASASFGQGITVTPVQILQAMSFATNDGVVLKPYIVDKIVDYNGNVTYQGKRKEVKKVYSEKTVKKMHSLMHSVIYEGLTDMWQPNNVNVMGKTGTAQIASESGGYLEGEIEYVRSFAGIFPEENPQYIIYVAANKLHGVARNIADVTKTAIEEIASYAKLTNSKSDVDYTKLIKVNNYISKKTEDISKELQEEGLVPVVLGSGKYIINQFPTKNEKVIAGSKVFILTNNESFIMPDMTNWSLNEVKTFCNLTNVTCNFNGYGYVISQSINKDDKITKDTIINFELVDKIKK